MHKVTLVAVTIIAIILLWEQEVIALLAVWSKETLFLFIILENFVRDPQYVFSKRAIFDLGSWLITPAQKLILAGNFSICTVTAFLPSILGPLVFWHLVGWESIQETYRKSPILRSSLAFGTRYIKATNYWNLVMMLTGAKEINPILACLVANIPEATGSLSVVVFEHYVFHNKNLNPLIISKLKCYFNWNIVTLIYFFVKNSYDFLDPSFMNRAHRFLILWCIIENTEKGIRGQYK